jgi:hypothetical protein
MQIKTKIVSCRTADSEPVEQEVNGTMILPPLVFSDLTYCILSPSPSLSLFLYYKTQLGLHGRGVPHVQTDRQVLLGFFFTN